MRFTKNLQETKMYEISEMEDKKKSQVFNLRGVDMKSGVNVYFLQARKEFYFSLIFLALFLESSLDSFVLFIS